MEKPEKRIETYIDLKHQLLHLKEEHLDCLSSFYVKEKHGFTRPKRDEDHPGELFVGLMSTCFCVWSLKNSDENIEDDPRFDPKFYDVTKKLILTKDWEYFSKTFLKFENNASESIGGTAFPTCVYWGQVFFLCAPPVVLGP